MYIYKYKSLLRMADTMTSQNIILSFFDTLYMDMPNDISAQRISHCNRFLWSHCFDTMHSSEFMINIWNLWAENQQINTEA
jgi:hypothetical protein